MSNAVGLSDYLTAGTELDDLVQVTKVENLFFMASGKLPSDSVGVLNSSRMMEFIEEVKGRYDLVFFDSPPILVVSDASILASCLDFVIMVVQHRRFPRSMAQRGKQAILNVGGNILGVAFTNVDVRHDQYFDYNTSYYNYHAKNTRETVEKPGNQGRNMKQSPMRLKDSENTTPDDY